MSGKSVQFIFAGKKSFSTKNVNKTKNKVISPLRFWAIMDIFYKANFFSISFHRNFFHFKHPSDPNKYYTSRKNDDEQVEKKLKKKIGLDKRIILNLFKKKISQKKLKPFQSEPYILIKLIQKSSEKIKNWKILIHFSLKASLCCHICKLRN
jgi:hypothetical protein